MEPKRDNKVKTTAKIETPPVLSAPAEILEIEISSKVKTTAPVSRKRGPVKVDVVSLEILESLAESWDWQAQEQQSNNDDQSTHAAIETDTNLGS